LSVTAESLEPVTTIPVPTHPDPVADALW